MSLPTAVRRSSSKATLELDDGATVVALVEGDAGEVTSLASLAEMAVAEAGVGEIGESSSSALASAPGSAGRAVPQALQLQNHKAKL